MQSYFDIFPLQKYEAFEYTDKGIFGYGRHIKATSEQLKCAIIDLIIDKDETFVFTINNNGKFEKYCMYSEDDYMFNKFKDMYNKNYKKDENIEIIDKLLLNPKYKKYILQKLCPDQQKAKQQLPMQPISKENIQKQKPVKVYDNYKDAIPLLKFLQQNKQQDNTKVTTDDGQQISLDDFIDMLSQ